MPFPFASDRVFPIGIHAQLRDVFSELQNGRPVRVLLHGDTGLGKTVSVRHLLKTLGIPNLLVLEGSGSPTRAAFHPVVQALDPVINQTSKDLRRINLSLKGFSDVVKQFLTRGNYAPTASDLASFIGAAQPATIKEAADLGFGMQRLLATIARGKTLVFFFRNLEVYDTSSISLIDTLLRNTVLPISYVFTYDSLAAGKQNVSNAAVIDEFTAEILPSRGVRLFEFRPFTEIETGGFIDHILHKGAFSTAEISSMHRLTGGNAGFLMELLNHLEQEGELMLEQGRYSLVQKSSLRDLPKNMARLIDLRVQRLQAELREVLDVAAVVGLEFQPEPITQILRLEHLTTLRRLRELERTHRLIIEEVNARRFTYEAIRNRVYQQLGSSLAQEHHLLLANFFAANPLPFDNDYVVQEHLIAAGKRRDALPHLISSAQQARTRASHLEAGERFIKAAQISEQLQLEVESTQALWMEGAISLQHAGKFSQAAVLYRHLLNSPHPRIVAFAQLSLGYCEYLSDDIWKAIRSLNIALERHGEHLMEEERTQVRLVLAAMLYHTGAWDAARAQYRKCFRDTLIRIDKGLLATVRKSINMYYLPELALPLLEESWHSMIEARMEPLRWELQHNVGCNYLFMGDLDRAAHLFEECLEAFERTGSYRSAYPMNNLGIVRMLQGRYDAADERFRAVREAPMSEFDRVSAECHLAVTQVLRGNVKAGVKELRLLVRNEDVQADRIMGELVGHNLGWALGLEGNVAEAEHYLRTSVPTRPHLWRDLKVASTARLLRRMGCALDSDALRQNEDLLSRSGRKDKWLFERFDFWISEVWFWE
jgi:tetratricopeptide (TPR) repeat protein